MEPSDYIPNYTIVKKLGNGSYGTVYEVYKNPVEEEEFIQYYAAKKIVGKIDITPDCLRELNCSLLVKGVPHVAQLHEFVIHDNNMYLIYDIAEQDLSHFIYHTPWPVREKQFRSIYKQLIRGLHYMRQRGIYHSDIKPSNILYNRGEVKYTDFGLSSRGLCQKELRLNTLGSTSGYRPPEYQHDIIDSTTDGYALGRTMLEYIIQARFPDYVDIQVETTIIEHNPNLRNFVAGNEDIMDELNRLLVPNVRDRMTASQSKFLGKANYSVLDVNVKPMVDDNIIDSVRQYCQNSRHFVIAIDCCSRYVHMTGIISRMAIQNICSLVARFIGIRKYSTAGFVYGPSMEQDYDTLSKLGFVLAGCWQDQLIMKYMKYNEEETADEMKTLISEGESPFFIT